MPIVELPNGSFYDIEGDLPSQPFETQEFVGECLEITGGTQTMETLSNGLEVIRSSQHTLSGMTIQQNFVYIDEDTDICGGHILSITNEIIS